MFTYIIINLLIFFPVFVLGFVDKKFYLHKKELVISIGLIAIPFLIWDYIATSRGDWSFNSKYVLGLYIGHLPVEEILFFITVPFSCLFIYHSVQKYIPEKQYKHRQALLLCIGIIFLLASIMHFEKYYTFTLSAATGIFLITSATHSYDMFFTKSYLFTIGITYVPFLLVNYVLTSLPVVEYAGSAFLGYRISTIPIEDFIYSFLLISGSIILYNHFVSVKKS